MYKRWDQAEKDYRTMSYGAVGAMALPLALVGAVESGAVYYTGQILQVGGRMALHYGRHAIRGSMMERLSNVAGDLTFQLASNGLNFGDVNLTSLGGSFLLPNSPYLNAFIGSAFQFSSNDKFNNSLLGKKSAGQVFFETGAGGLFGDIGNRASNTLILQKMYGKMGSNYFGDFFGNMIPGVGSMIHEQATKKPDE